VAAWPLLTLLLLPSVAGQYLRKRIKQAGLRAKVMGNNFPEIQQVVRSQCSVLGLREPNVFVVEDDMAFITTLAGGRSAVVITRPALDALTGDELAAAIAQELGHIKAGHVRMMNLLAYVRGARRIWQAVWFPASVMSILMQGWSDVIEWTADRCALLLTGRAQAVNAAMVKLALEADALAQIDSRELADYLSAGRELATDAEQVERHFRIGTFITDTPGLTERIRALSDFARSEGAKEGFTQVAEIRGG
jgi:Zn-dependent protease with chaperone function